MNSVRNKIAEVIKKSNGLPNFTRREYLDSVGLLLKSEFSDDELDFIQSHKVNLDKWIMEITKEITEDQF